MLRIKLVRSKAGNNWRNNATVAALGLRKVGQVVEKEDSSSIRGMVHKVKHMLAVEEVAGEVAKKAAPKHAVKKAAPKAAATVAVAEKPKAAAPKKAAKTEEAPAEEKPKAKRTTKKATEAGE